MMFNAFAECISRQRVTLGFGVVFILIVLAVAFGFSSEAQPFASVELQFADVSIASGLEIVPASCPSYWHYSGECLCPPGKILKGGICVDPPPCPGGALYDYESGRCTTVCPNGLPVPSNGVCQPGSGCPDNLPRLPDGTCHTGQCPSGYTLVNGTCVLTSCPSGYTLVNGTCVLTSCPAGYTLVNGKCVTQCVPQYSCSGADVYYKNAQCTSSFVRSCEWGCTAGACNPPPSPEGDIRVSPALVKSGDTTQVIWSTQYVSSCTVTGTNGNSWTDLSSGVAGKTSYPITEQVTFTLSCNALPGATPATFTDTATVNLIPYWQED